MGVVQQDVFDASTYDGGVQRLGAHQHVGVECPDDRVHHLGLKVWGVRELFLRVACRLLRQCRRLQQLPHEDVIHVDELILVGEFALEQDSAVI